MVYFDAMENTRLSGNIPTDLYAQLEAEASNESRSINKQLIAILKERYRSHAPPITTKSPARNLSRKPKQKAEAN